MNDDLEKKLVERFPTLFRQVGKTPMESCMAFGCDCGNGWYRVLYDLCLKIESLDPEKTFQFEQIKEKWGLLRVYYTTGAGCDSKAIGDAIDEAEVLSGKYCEACGSQENVTTAGPGWIVSRCQECRENKTPVEDARKRHAFDLEQLLKYSGEGK
jgi:hypothetical protein